MADVQKYFEQFNGTIQLGRFDENETLREKRNIIRRRLDDKLPGVFARHKEDCPSWKFYDQGSYDMGLGVKPLDGDYDIDQGMYFDVRSADWDPVILKKRVREALDGHTKEVRIRKPCVTVQYQSGGEPVYHVDIAVYAGGDADGKARLAVGRESTPSGERRWEVSSPRTLKAKVFDKFKDDERAQFRRVVRYLKRWKDVKFSSNGNAAPLGIAFTVLAYDNLLPTFSDAFTGEADDLGALRKLVKAVLGRFVMHYSPAKGNYRRLIVSLPVEPWNDLFEHMSDAQITDFEEKLTRLRDALDEAADATDPVETCKKLNRQFGDDFPIPEKSETAKQQSRAIITSSVSA
jgi:hypothetical protein